MKKNVVVVPGLRWSVKISLFLGAALCAIFMSSCATNQGSYKFTVLLYDNPVYVPHWKFDDTHSDTPEGAALNIITDMQHGDMNHWLASWDPADRPNLSSDQQSSLLHEWQSLKDERLYMVGRIVADNNVIVELSVKGNSQATFKFPLRKANDKWWLFSMDSGTECLNWENSPNKIIETMQATMIQRCMVNDTNLQTIARQ